jgi:hypothetical protein
MLLSLFRLLDEEIDLLQGRHLDKDYFNSLLTKRDPVREVLQWLDQGEAYKASVDKNTWKAFVGLCKSQLGFDPDKEGILAGGTKLAKHEGPWQPVWERFCESPKRFRNIPVLLRRCKAPTEDLFWPVSGINFSGWPQWNEDQENKLRGDLLALANVDSQRARSEVLELEIRHKIRRDLVWAELGEAPLALSLASLAVLAQVTGNSLIAGTTDDLAEGYQTYGWRADDAVLNSLSAISSDDDFKAVTNAIRIMYVPWIEESARYLQKVVQAQGYPGGNFSTAKKAVTSGSGECILFVDGLRFDVAKRLVEKLTASDCEVQGSSTWAALPSVTPTGKPAVSPVREKLRGYELNSDFEPIVAETGQSLRGGYHIKRLLGESGWEILERSAHGAGHGNAWCEFGDIDSLGHDHGWKLSKHLDGLLEEIKNRVVQLLKQGGWKTVRIVTDHGWLLVPGGLPKVDLPTALTDTKWGRCAAVKSGAKTQERFYPWYWNPSQQFALADGISCFRKNEEYAHGGLSLQECLNLELSVSLVQKTCAANVEITDIGWKGLRCVVAVEGRHDGLEADVRSQAGNPESSLVVSPKPFKDNGTTSLVVEDEELQGSEAFVVVIDTSGAMVSQRSTWIGGVKNGS